MTEPALRVTGVAKAFGASNALTDVSFEVARGEVHALVGENGAGKSTLVKIITGILEPDAGEIALNGEVVRFTTPIEARRAGVAAVYQDPKLFPHLDVAENISMGATPVTAFGTVDRKAAVARAREALTRLGVAIEPSALIAGLSMAELQFVEIARALTADLRLLILDEPTSALTPAEVEKLFRIVKTLRDRGTSVVLITHRLEELDLIADAVTVLRDGRHVATRPASELSRAEIVRMMVGRPIETLFAERKAKTPGREVLRVDGLGLEGVFSDVSFSLHAGEIVGMAGLVGAGRSEIAHACFGLTPPTSGRVTLDGRPVAPQSPKQMLSLGLAYLPEDRDGVGLIMSSSIVGNVTLPIVDRLARLGVVDESAELRVATEAVKTYDVRTTGVDQLVSRPVGRKPAEGRVRQMAVDEAEGPDPRRAHAWHRRRFEGAGPPDDRASRRRRTRGPCDLVRPSGGACDQRSHPCRLRGRNRRGARRGSCGPDRRHDGRDAKRAGACRCPLTLARSLRKPRKDPSDSSRCASA